MQYIYQSNIWRNILYHFIIYINWEVKFNILGFIVLKSFKDFCYIWYLILVF